MCAPPPYPPHPPPSPATPRWIFGAQLLINYANDKLQYYFTQTAISLLLAQYEEEGVSTSSLLRSFDDVSPSNAPTAIKRTQRG